ncbi:MAG TPA: TIGR00153 family protein [Gammaproteobacteria bacterium]|nr:TIGR00153 family protein [Gammaproteobacteria bacterium]
MSASFFDIFAQSPFKTIQEHMDHVVLCVEGLSPFFEAVLVGDWEQALVLQDKVAELEGQADALKQQIRLQLPHSLFMPVSRSDLLELLTRQDKIANKAKDVAGLIVGRRLVFPEAICQSFREYIASIIPTTQKASEAINEFDVLLEIGFRGHEADLVKKMIIDLDRLEKKTDTIQVKVRSQLFDVEKNYNPIDVMFLYKIIDWVGDIADLAQQVGHRLQVLLAK